MIKLHRDSTISRNYRHQSGFILSMEAVLLFTILGIGLFVGMSVLRNSLIKYHFNQVNTRFFVADSSTTPILIGDVVGFDEHETPLVVFTDYYVSATTNALPGDFNYRALVGVRDDRFTTRQPVLYSDATCSSVAVCIAVRSSEAAHGLIGGAAGTGTISYLNAMQGTDAPVYAVGRTSTQDYLYRSTTAPCVGPLLSMWVSQTLGSDAQSCIAVNESGMTEFRLAEAVPMPTGSNNVLQGLTAPFFVNMIDNPLVQFSPTTPTDESNTPAGPL